jgi:hypothetical protein
MSPLPFASAGIGITRITSSRGPMVSGDSEGGAEGGTVGEVESLMIGKR